MKVSKIVKKIRLVPGVNSYILVSLAVAAIGLLITLFTWYADRQQIEAENRVQVNEQVKSISDDVTNRLNIYQQIIRGANGLLLSSDVVSRDEWRQFIANYNIQKTYPGVANVGYIEHVPANSLDGFIGDMRTEGFSNYSIKPAGQRSEYALIKYVEPFPGGSARAFGYDMFTEPTRRNAMIKARDSGRTVLTRKLKIIDEKEQEGFWMVTPVYRENAKISSPDQRKNALQGYVYALFSTDDFFVRTIDKSKFSAFKDVQIFDGSGTDTRSLLYETDNFTKYSPGQTSQAFTYPVLDSNWTYRFAGPVNDSNDFRRSLLILLSGTLLSITLAGILFLVMYTRARELVYTKQKEAQQAKDDLLSLASHQLRTPATAVKQYIGMMLEGYAGKVNAKLKPLLHKAYVSNERQLETINQILYVAKADAGRLSINKEKMDINTLIDDIVAELMDLVEDSDQSLTVEKSSKRLFIWADENCMRMIIENLITNASKYSHPGGRILIKTGTKNNEAFISVEDQGVGIAKEDFDKLFQKFSRIDNDLSLQAGGTGIGLYIDKVLIELHEGRMEVESEVDIGSVFTVYLPKTNKGGK